MSATKSEDLQSNEKTREVKVRRTKAGFEPYQVKRNLPSSVLESKTTQSPSRSSSKGSSDSKSRKSSEEKDRRHSSSSSRSRDRKSSQSKSNQSTTFPKQSEKSSKGKSSTPSKKNDERKDDSQHKVVEKKEKPKLTKEQEEKLRQKTLGLSILECPCSLTPSENCTDCSPIAEKKEMVSQDVRLNETPEKIEKSEGSVIDTKFLVASPRALPKEKSALDSDNEELEPSNQSVDNLLSNDYSNNNTSSMTHDEINSLFTNVKKDGDRHSSVSGNSDLFVSEEGLSNSAITISSSSDNDSSQKINVEHENTHSRKGSKNSDSSSHHPRQRNVLSSIQSILIENKSLDTKTKSPTRTNNNDNSSSDRRKEDRNSQKESNRKQRRDSNKKKQNKRESNKSKNDNTETIGDSTNSKHSPSGILTLPQDCQSELHNDKHLKDSSPQIKQVHFVVSGKLFYSIFLDKREHNENLSFFSRQF